MIGNLARILIFSACLAVCGTAAAEYVYWEPQEFLRDAFSGQVAETKVLWLTDEHRAAAARILQHSPHMLRVRYWRAGGRTAWILEEIGKERPITVGVVVDGGAIDHVAVLIYRESIGWEVKHRFFTQTVRAGRA